MRVSLVLSVCWLAACSTAGAEPVAEQTGDVAAQVPTPPAALASVAPTASAAPLQRAAPGPEVAAPPPSPCPAEMALVPGSPPLCVDRYEAHLARVEPGGSLSAHPHTARPAAGVRYRALSAAGVFPQAYINRDEAQAACEEAGKRLCTRAEWTRACRRAGQTGYPYGAQPEAGACNSGKTHLLPILFPERGWRFLYEENFNSPALNLTPGFLARTGEYERCVNELGVHDTVGNVHEWVSDTVSSAFLASFEAEARRQWQPSTPGNGIFMGGFYSTSGEHGSGCAFTTVAHEPKYHDYSTGFRCCAATSSARPP